MVKPFLDKAFDLLKSDVHAAKMGLEPSKTLHYPSCGTQTGKKKGSNKALNSCLLPDPILGLFEQTLLSCYLKGEVRNF